LTTLLLGVGVEVEIMGNNKVVVGALGGLEQEQVFL
jgi:hypothetical protein